MIRRLIKRFTRGDSKRTALSASVMNELVDSLNMFLRARPDKGIKLYFADGGLVIGLDDFVRKQLLLDGDGQGGAGNGEQAPGTLKWRGVYSLDETYEPNDLVIVTDDTSGTGGLYPLASYIDVGTFIAVDDVPVNTPPNYTDELLDVGAIRYHPSGTYWKPVAVPHYRYQEFRDDGTETVQIRLNGATGVINAGSVEATNIDASDVTASVSVTAPIVDSNNLTNVRMDIDEDEIPVGEELRVRSVTYMINATTTETRYFACTEPI